MSVRRVSAIDVDDWKWSYFGYGTDMLALTDAAALLERCESIIDRLHGFCVLLHFQLELHAKQVSLELHIRTSSGSHSAKLSKQLVCLMTFVTSQRLAADITI